MMKLSRYGLKLEITRSKPFYAYRHPNSDISNFIEHVESTFTKFNKDKYNVFLMGDFNIDLLRYDSPGYTRDLVNSMISHFFYRISSNHLELQTILLQLLIIYSQISLILKP